MYSIAANQEVVNSNLLPRKITSSVEANQGHSRLVLTNKMIEIRSNHKCVKMHAVFMTDKENSLYHNKFCLNIVEKSAGCFNQPASVNPANLSQTGVPRRCHHGCWAPAVKYDTTSNKGDFQTKKKVYTVGFDAEWLEVAGHGKRYVLSYQLAMYTEDGSLLEFILFPEGRRISMGRLFSIFRQELYIEFGIEIEGHLKDGKEFVMCNLISHYSLVDISTFFDSMDILRNTDTVRRTQISIEKPLFIDVYDKDYHHKQTWVVNVRDTMTLAPANSKLETLAKAMGKHKLVLPESYDKNDMRKFLLEQEEEFMLYAANDATLALDYVKQLYSDKKIPPTLGAEGAEIFRETIKELNGWNDKLFDFHFRGLDTIRDNDRHTKLIPRKELAGLYEIANHCYYGGRNETFLYGIHHAKDGWNDYDLSGAYPTAMACLRTPNFDQIGVMTGDILSIDPLGYAFGLVDFEFPPDTPFPCLPVKDEQGRGLIFPLKGRTFASAPELYAALRMGAKIKWVKYGLQVGTFDKFDMQEALTDLVRQRAEAKRIFGKGSIQEIRLKEMINSVYGKLAQGLAGKRNYSTRIDKVEDTPPSSITQPLLASMTTSLVRAIVSVAMHQLHMKGFRIASVTTDGFLTDAPFEVLNSLNLFGFKAIYEAVRGMMTGDPTMWETKHKCLSLIAMTTRGQIGVGYIGDSKVPVAKAGYKPESNFTERYGDKAPEELARRFLMRKGKLEMGYYKLPSPKEYIRKGADGVGIFQKKTIEWEYDLKRKPTNIRMEKMTIGDQTYEHVAFDTVPWNTIEDFIDARAVRKAHPEIYPLKDTSKAEMLTAMIKEKEAARKANMVIQSANVGGVYRTAVISFLRDLLAGREPMPEWMQGLSYAQLAEAFNERLKGYNIVLSIDDFKNAKRRSNKGRLEDSEALELVKSLLK